MLQIRLKELRDQYGYSQQDLANKIGVKQSTVGMWENGKNKPRHDTLIKLANIFNISIDELTGEGVESNVQPFSYGETETIRIPVYGSIPAGIPMEAIEDILDYEEAPASWALGGKEFFALKIQGNSMEPEYRNGDVIIFLKQPDCENNEDCAVAINGNDWTFKRVEKLEDGVLIKPLNPDYETKFFTREQCESLPVEVKGVFWEMRRNRRG